MPDLFGQFANHLSAATFVFYGLIGKWVPVTIKIRQPVSHTFEVQQVLFIEGPINFLPVLT
jgi:hypothetical protein